ncbi:hypothetical protein ABPG75_013135 [Micractinium tetrahymenae]
MPSPPKLSAAGRPVRKRKANSFAEDMVSTDEVLRRGGRARPAPAVAAPPAPIPRVQPVAPPFRPLPPGSVAAAAAGAAAAAAAAGLPALQLVSMPTANGGRAVRLAVPAAALLAMPQLLRAPGAVGGRGLPQPVPVGAMPFRLVAPGQPAPPPGQPAPPSIAAAPASGGQQQQEREQQQQPQQHEVPAVHVAAPRDIARLARQLDEEERRKALAAAATARVALRALPGAQLVGLGGRGPAGKPPTPAGRGGGRGRGGSRPSRWPTPEPAEQGRPANLPPGTWHPGFECLGGVTYVSAQQGAAAPPPSAVVAGVPPRFAEAAAAAGQGQQPEYALSEDPLHAAVDFLHYTARTVGRPPPQYSRPVAAAVSAEQAQLTEQLARAQFARDGRKVHKQGQGPGHAVAAEPTRRSTRARSAPGIFSPELTQQQALRPKLQAQQAQQQAQQQRGTRAKQRTHSPEEETDVRVGEEHQAELPAVRPRPAVPSAEEARWLAGEVSLPAAGPMSPAPASATLAASMAQASAGERAAQVAQAHAALRGMLGEERAAAMGLLSMGSGACSLTAEEEAGLEAGMLEFGREFHTIRLEHVPTRSVFDLQNYYFNVWKLQATQRSKDWYARQAAEKAAWDAELARQQAAAEAEAEAARLRQERRQKERPLREVVGWIKAAARAPAEVPSRPTVAQRAQRAARLVGRLAEDGRHGL